MPSSVTDRPSSENSGTAEQITVASPGVNRPVDLHDVGRPTSFTSSEHSYAACQPVAVDPVIVSETEHADVVHANNLDNPSHTCELSSTNADSLLIEVVTDTGMAITELTVPVVHEGYSTPPASTMAMNHQKGRPRHRCSRTLNNYQQKS